MKNWQFWIIAILLGIIAIELGTKETTSLYKIESTLSNIDSNIIKVKDLVDDIEGGVANVDGYLFDIESEVGNTYSVTSSIESDVRYIRNFM